MGGAYSYTHRTEKAKRLSVSVPHGRPQHSQNLIPVVFFCFWFSVFRWRQQLKKHNADQNMSRIFPSACIRQRTSHFNFPFSHAVTTFLFFSQAITMSKSDDPGGRPFLLLFILCVCVYIYFTINIHLL